MPDTDLRDRIARAREKALSIPLGLCPADCTNTSGGLHAHNIEALLDAYDDAVLAVLGDLHADCAPKAEHEALRAGIEDALGWTDSGGECGQRLYNLLVGADHA